MFRKKKNTGILHEDPKPSDYMIGASPIEHEVRLFNGNWEDYLPEDEWQKKNNVETMSCVSFSALNSVEMQINWMLAHNKLRQDTLDFLYQNEYIRDGKVNFSDKFIAILSETTPRGNYMEKVARTIRNYGMIPEQMLPFGEPKTWDEYHNPAQITEEMKELGLEFLKHFVIRYEWVHTTNTGGLLSKQRADRLHHLRHAPLQMATERHATAYYLGVDKVRWGEYDSYSPFRKDRSWTYFTPACLKILVEEKSMYTDEEIRTARAEVKKVVINEHDRVMFFRPDANGEAYYVNQDGSFKYYTAKGSLFTHLTRPGGEILPIPETLWEKFKPAELK